jgi:molecular chaperone GrpE
MSLEEKRKHDSSEVVRRTETDPSSAHLDAEKPSEDAIPANEKVERPHIDEKQLVATLRKELENEKKKNSELSKRMLYLQSDFANLQRQSERRIADAKDETKLRFIEELISVKEDLERAMSVAKSSSSGILFDGLRMLLARVEGTLRSEEVERINATSGTAFDPRLHEAVAYSDGDPEKDSTILSVVSHGYTMRGKVIKPALVEVVRKNQDIMVEDRSHEIMKQSLRDADSLSMNMANGKETGQTVPQKMDLKEKKTEAN